MDALAELVGDSPQVVALRSKVRRLLDRQAGMRRLPPILIQGETGTGKGLLARLIHRAGPNAGGPFVEVNCAAIPENLLEAELFGYERGAFTDARQAKPGLFETANGGTLFLDEVGLLAHALQGKLLTVLEQGAVRRLGATRSETISVSIVAATNQDLLAAVRDGGFREDLYHRLAVLRLDMPPLRERRGDIEHLADGFLVRACVEYGLPAKRLGETARAVLRAYSWPGNVRELNNVLERAVLLSQATTLTAEMLQLGDPFGTRVDKEGPPAAGSGRRVSRERLEEVLARTGWNITRTAAELRITRNTVRARIERYGLRQGSERGEGDRARSASPAALPPSRAPSAELAPGGPSWPVRGVRWDRRRVMLLRASIVAGGADRDAPPPRVLARLIDKAVTFGGHVADVSRRGVIVAFGLEPSEDAPWRAANSAIAMLKTVERDRQSGRLGEPLTVALAIHTTRGLVASMGSSWHLDEQTKAEAWHTLDQLVSMSRDDIVVSEAAAPLLDRHFHLQPAGGEGAPHRLLGRTIVTDLPPSATFVGREGELEQLRSLLDRARRGQGQAVSIVGEPGIGKSRLLRELREVLPEDVALLETRCVSYGRNVPYLPVVDLLHAVFGVEESDPPARIEAKIVATLARLGETAATATPYLSRLLSPEGAAGVAGESPATIRARTFEALQHLVVLQQARGPLVLVIEDLHWIDETSAALLGSLVDLAVAARVLVVGTLRPGHEPPWRARSHVSQIALAPLSDPDSRQLIASVLPPDVAHPVIDRIVDRAEGNPFFLEELARTLQERGGRPGGVPDTIHDVLAARIDALSEADRQVLRAAAVIGRDVPLSLLSEACEQGPDALRPVLNRLQAGEFVHTTRVSPEPEYTFKHALTWDVAYESLHDPERRVLHERVGAAIEKLFPETRERRPETLARHYTEAGRPAPAVAYWLRAGQLAAQRCAHDAAIPHLDQGLSLLQALPAGPDRDRQELEIQAARALVLSAVHGYARPEVEQAYGRAHELCREFGDTPQVFPVLYGLALYRFVKGELDTARGLGEQLLGIAEAARDSDLRLAARVLLAMAVWHLGDAPATKQHAEAALADYDPGDHARLMATYGQDSGLLGTVYLALAEAVLGQFDRATALVRETVRLGEGRSVQVCTQSLTLGMAVLTLAAEIPDVLARGDQCVALTGEQQFAHWQSETLVWRGWARARSGRPAEGVADIQRGLGDQPDEAERCYRQAVDVAHTQQARLWELRAAISLARLCRDRGQLARAREVLEPVYASFTEGFDLPDLREARALL